jgi:hypothetical protein
VLTSTRQERQLEPRYRRILSFGDVLDESIGLFRRHWVVFALVSAICLIPPGLLAVSVTGSGAFDTNALARQLRTGRPPTLESMSGFAGAALLLYVVSLLFYLAWTTAIVVTTDEYLHAGEPKARLVFTRTLQRYLPALLSGLVYFVAFLILMLVATLILVLYALAFPVSLVGILAAIVGAIIWLVQPRTHSAWLKWLIVVAMPFGLPAYFGGTMSMYLAAAIIERRGPIGAVRRSLQLVEHHWFRVVSILFVAGTIVSVLQYVPAMLIQVPLTVAAAARGQLSLSPTELALSTAAGVVAQVLFASMASIVYSVVFVDLRNRREGTDIAERVSQLELANG